MRDGGPNATEAARVLRAAGRRRVAAYAIYAVVCLVRAGIVVLFAYLFWVLWQFLKQLLKQFLKIDPIKFASEYESALWHRVQIVVIVVIGVMYATIYLVPFVLAFPATAAPESGERPGRLTIDTPAV